jgi:hypothetical protein
MNNVLWTPPSARTYRAPKVSREHWEQMLAWEAQVQAAMHWEGGILDHWTAELAKLDPLLCLAQAGPGARVPGVMPDLYHLVRRRDPASATFMMLTPLHVNGKFVEPSEAMLRGLRAADLQNPRAVRDRMQRDIDAARSAAGEERRDDEDRVDEMVGRLNAITRTQVSLTDAPWAQNVKGTKRPTKGRGR